jgi:DNA repair ATPase RecN
MKRRIVLTVLLILVSAAGFLVYTQWNNIRALTFFLLHDEEQIQEMLAQNAEAITHALEKIPDITVRGLTEDELKRLENNEITQEQAVLLILGHDDSPNEIVESTASGTETAANGTDTSPSANAAQAEISPLEALIAEIYLLQFFFMNELNRLSDEAKAEYSALNEAERTDANQQQLALKYMRKAADLEAICDGLLKDLLIRMEIELIAVGGDVSLINDINIIYANEKSLRKAEFLSTYAQ